MCAFSGGVAAEIAREWTPAQRRANYLASSASRIPASAPRSSNDRFMDWPSDAWTRARLLVPRARPGHDASARCCARASARPLRR